MNDKKSAEGIVPVKGKQGRPERRVTKGTKALSMIVRESGRRAQEEFERVLHAIHRMHNFIAVVPEKLTKLAETLKNRA